MDFKNVKIPRTAIAFGSADTTKDYNFTLDIFKYTTNLILIELPDFTNAVTAQVQLINSDDNKLYSISALAKNAKYVLMVARPLVGNEKITVTLSGEPGGSGGTVYITVYLN